MQDARDLKKGSWTPQEDAILRRHVSRYGEGNWSSVQEFSGLPRSAKSCRLRWLNQLCQHSSHQLFQLHEVRLIIEQHAILGNEWSRIAAMLPGRTDKEIKTFWNIRKLHLSRAGFPLYPDDLVTQVSSLEDVREDICVTMASSQQVERAASPTKCEVKSSIWSYTTVNLTDLKAGNAFVAGNKAVGAQTNDAEEMGREDVVLEKKRSSIYSGKMVQPFSKRRCEDGSIRSHAMVYHDSKDFDENSISCSHPMAGGSNSNSNMTKKSLATSMHGEVLLHKSGAPLSPIEEPANGSSEHVVTHNFKHV